MTPEDTPKAAGRQSAKQRAALESYLRAIRAAARCMAVLCPQVGIPYRERLLRLPHRLGDGPTPHALEESTAALESDLNEYAAAANEWIREEAGHARKVLDAVAQGSAGVSLAADSRAAALEDIADQMEACAQIDSDGDVRLGLRRYATGLRSYARRAKKEEAAFLDELRRQTQDLEDWLHWAHVATTVDVLAGMVNRREMESHFSRRLDNGRGFCVLLARWAPTEPVPHQAGRKALYPVAQQIGQRLATLVRPRDIVCHWSSDCFAVIFECTQTEAEARCGQIAGWLSDTYESEVGRVTFEIPVRAVVEAFEPHPGETVEAFSARLDRAWQSESVV